MKLDDLFTDDSAENISENAYAYTDMGKRIRHFAKSCPNEPALVDHKGALSYAELWAQAEQLAYFLRHQAKMQSPVALLTARNRYHYIAMLGTWLARNVGLALDPQLPKSRLAYALQNSNASVILTDYENAGLAEKLSIACNVPMILVCLEAAFFEDAIELPGALMNQDLWKLTSQGGADASWKSYFNKQPLLPKHLAGMADNVCHKVQHFLHENAHVLDIGSGCGAVAQALLTKSGTYTAAGISSIELEDIQEFGKKNHRNVRTHVMEAIEVALLEEKFDLIVLNSVLENFPGYNYTRSVLNAAVEKLQDTGALFVGMVWDLARKEEFKNKLEHYAKEHGDSSGFLRLCEDEELFIPKVFFENFAKERNDITLHFSDPHCGLEELDKYRFDVVIEKKTPQSSQKAKTYRFGREHIQNSKPVPLEDIQAHDLAYITYTSGSTGKAKGVMLEHGSLMNLMDNLLEQVYAPLKSPQLKSAVLASFAFDACMQAWASLCHGASLHIIEPQLRHDPQKLHDYLCQWDITLCDATPSLFNLLLNHWKQSNTLPKVKTWLLGGEVLQLQLLQQFFALKEQENVCIFNAYGPTEACVDVSLHPLFAHNISEYSQPPLGKALKGIQLKVCDARGNGIADGIPGELWIGGVSLARGYLGEPSENAENTHMQTHFVQHNGQRWYKSGDIVYKQNGLFFYCKREDEQVKVNGYRVELGEVEAALLNCPVVEQTAVIAGDFLGQNMTSLAAYIIPCKGMDENLPLENVLRNYLLQYLPAYAIPTLFIKMTRFPLTPSGKISRNNLPLPTFDVPTHSARAPQGKTELLIANIWSELLGRNIQDAEADFFTLGGHSILGVRLISSLEAEFNRRLPLSAIFMNPSIAKQAQLIEQEQDQHTKGVQILELSPDVPTQKMLFLFHPTGGSTVCYKDLASLLQNSAKIFAVEPPPLLSRQSFPKTIQDMAQQYAKAILPFVTNNPSAQYYLGGWSFGGIVAFETARFLRRFNLQESALIIIDSSLDTQAQKNIAFKDEGEFILDMLGKDIVEDIDAFYALSSSERRTFLVQLGIERGRLPAGFNEEHMQSLIQTFYSNTRAAARYIPTPLEARALLLRAQSTQPSISKDIYAGWKENILHDIALHMVNGNHESILQAQNVAQLAAIINQYIEE